jgi:hypothetical protein
MHQLEAREREEATPPDHQDAIDQRLHHGEDFPPGSRAARILAARSGSVLTSPRDPLKANFLENAVWAK